MKKDRNPNRYFMIANALLLTLALSACGKQQETPKQPEVATGGDPARGKDLIVKYGCKTCHTIDSIDGPNGVVGPPLNDIKSRSYIAGVLTNTPAHIQEWIMDPPKVKPGTAMPKLGVSEQEAQDIAAFLYSQ
ncbi:MAG TPA: c-type cytochrome [Methylophilaceae bacterium]|nr:c-type cytochrome [Methylophilaceae bacterium]